MKGRSRCEILTACYLSLEMLPLDTSESAAKLQEQSYVRMGESGRLLVALELSDLTHSVAVAGVRSRQPDLGDDQARRALAEILYGPAS